MSRVLILGCGPSGLVAAHVAETMGWEVVLVSEKRKSYIAGAQYLHSFIEGLTEENPDDKIRVEKLGTQEGYAVKVYGNPNALVSWSLYEDGEFECWNLRRVYDELWDRWEDRINDIKVTSRNLGPEVFTGEYAKVISTIPKREICHRVNDPFKESHEFLKQAVHIVQREDAFPGSENLITYNGEKAPSWYRRSVIFGTEAVEWSGQMKKPPVEGLVTINKPYATNCDCWHGTIACVGRYGAWNKRWLTDHVAAATKEILT